MPVKMLISFGLCYLYASRTTKGGHKVLLSKIKSLFGLMAFDKYWIVLNWDPSFFMGGPCL